MICYSAVGPVRLSQGCGASNIPKKMKIFFFLAQISFYDHQR